MAAAAPGEGMFRAIAEAASTAGIAVAISVIADGQPKNLFLNEHAIDLFGLDPEDALSVPFWDLIAPEARPGIEERVARRLAGEGMPLRFETVIAHRSGTRIPVEVSTARVDIEGRPGNVTFVTDISDRRRHEEELAQSLARSRLLTESSPDGVGVLRRGRFLYVNPSGARMLGFDDPNALIGQAVGELAHPDDRERMATRLRAVEVEGAPPLVPSIYRFIRPDGLEVSVEIRSHAIEWEGEPAVLGMARDVTEREAMQRQLTQADRLAAVGLLAAGVAHEINNPLAYVLLNLEHIERRLAQLVDDSVELGTLLALLRDAAHGADRVRTIVRDLRTFARTEDAAPGPVDLHAVIDAALRLCDNEIRHRARLVRDYGTIPSVEGNVARLEQVFLNLLINAAHACAPARASTNEIVIRSRATEDDQVSVDITDTGDGMTQATVDRIFDPFFTTKPVGSGTGLGLSICRSIVVSLGGSIEAESAHGRGSTFRVTLRAYRGAEAPMRPPTPRLDADAPPAARPISVLIVEDDPRVARVMELALEGHLVTVAATGAEALLLVDAASFDVVLCDVMMPTISGPDLYTAVRRRHPDAARRFLFVTGGAFTEATKDFLATVDVPVLRKPFRADELRSAIDHLLRRLDSA